MHIIEAPVNTLLPCQSEVTETLIRTLEECHRDGISLPPIPVVPRTPGIHDRELILPDGHHRAFLLASVLGRTSVFAEVYENDDDILRARHGLLIFMKSHAQMVVAYDGEYGPAMVEQGIHDIRDLRVKL